LDQDSITIQELTQEQNKNTIFEIRMQQDLKLPIGAQQRTKPTN